MKLERWGWYSIALNALLAGLHATVATASGSLAVTAELVHNAVDLLSAAAVLAGLNLAMRKSKAFPYDLYKVENVVATGLAAMIFVSAYEIACEALLAPDAPVHADGWMLGVLAVTGTLLLVFGHFELRAGRAANSPALVADAKEYRVHAFTTGLAFVALVSQWLDVPLDHIAALIIVVAVVWMGWGLLRNAVPHVERALIHLEAPDSPYVRYAVPLAALDGTVSQHFGEAPSFALMDTRHSAGVLEEQRIVSNPHAKEAKAKGIRVAEWLVTQKIDVLLTRGDILRKGPAYVLREAGVELRMTGKQTIGEAILAAIRS
jgi:cation diffusion facilitator family transporter